MSRPKMRAMNLNSLLKGADSAISGQSESKPTAPIVKPPTMSSLLNFEKASK